MAEDWRGATENGGSSNKKVTSSPESGVRGRRVAGRLGNPGRRGRGVKLWYRSKCMGAFLSRRVDPARIIISRHHLHKELVDKDNELYSALKFKSQKRFSLVSNKS